MLNMSIINLKTDQAKPWLTVIFWSTYNKCTLVSVISVWLHMCNDSLKLFLCCCQVVWQKWTNQIKIFLFHISINLFRSWHTFIKNKLMRISLFIMIVCQLRNKFMIVQNKNILIWFVHFCQTTWQQQTFCSTIPHFSFLIVFCTETIAVVR